jgi:tripartite-type tricarboxylate transporter receptor subunit TctC
MAVRMTGAVAAMMLALCAGTTNAADTRTGTYPTRPVRFIVAQSAGGNADFVARMVSAELSKQLGQQFVVDNRGGGGGGVLAAELVVRAAPDGYTMLLVGSSFGVNPSLYKKLPYDSERDLAPITLASTDAFAFGIDLAFAFGAKSSSNLLCTESNMCFISSRAASASARAWP